MATILFKWILIATLAVNWHPFYVGVTEINHNKEEKTLEISVKLFIDDFEKALNAQYKTTVDLANPKNQEQNDRMVSDYIQKNLQMKVDGQLVDLHFVGYEKEREAAWCYLQVNEVTELKKLDINLSLLYNVLDQQIHLIHIQANNQRKSGKIMYPVKLFSAAFN